MTTDNDAPAAGLVEAELVDALREKLVSAVLQAKRLLDHIAEFQSLEFIGGEFYDGVWNAVDAAYVAVSSPGSACRDECGGQGDAFGQPGALSALSQPVATPAPRPQLGTIPNYPEYDNARIK